MKTVATITGIRPDFIRMRNIFRLLDNEFVHIMIHTGQHYDEELSANFFRELRLRRPDYILDSGGKSSTQYEHLSYLAHRLPFLFKQQKIAPELVLFLGDSNSVLASVPLFKEGYRIGHIEGGMRSYDRRMPEEVNRVICDYVSDLIFVYTPLYKQRLIAENKAAEHIFVVGNPITEMVREYMPEGKKKKNYLAADIHRNENLDTKEQYAHILQYLNKLGQELDLPVMLVKFRRAVKLVGEDFYKQFKLINLVGPYGFIDYLKLQYHAYGVISDSGTSQEECPLLGVPVAVPRNATERPESVEQGNSILVGEYRPITQMVEKTVDFFYSYSVNKDKIRWLGDGKTSQRIVKLLKQKL